MFGDDLGMVVCWDDVEVFFFGDLCIEFFVGCFVFVVEYYVIFVVVGCFEFYVWCVFGYDDCVFNFE